MKSDLATSAIVFAVGAGIAYFACNMMLPPIKSVSIETVEGDSNYSIEEPDNEVFNYRAINPTVEVYIGDCTAYDDRGNCIMDPDNPSPEQDEAENNPETPEENGGENEEENKEEKPEEENANKEEEPENGPTD